MKTPFLSKTIRRSLSVTAVALLLASTPALAADEHADDHAHDGTGSAASKEAHDANAERKAAREDAESEGGKKKAQAASESTRAWESSPEGVKEVTPGNGK